MKIEAGKRYMRRDGEVTGYMVATESYHLFLDPDRKYWYDIHGNNDDFPDLPPLINEYMDLKEATSSTTRTKWRYEMARRAMTTLMALSPDEPYTNLAETAVKIADILLNELEKSGEKEES